MKVRAWGIVAIFISGMSWLWLILLKPNSSVWECTHASSATAVVLVIFTILTSTSIISNVFLIMLSKDNKLLRSSNTKAKIWGILLVLLSTMFLQWAWVGVPSLSIAGCAEASFVLSDVVIIFTIVTITSIVSGIILIKGW